MTPHVRLETGARHADLVTATMFTAEQLKEKIEDIYIVIIQYDKKKHVHLVTAAVFTAEQLRENTVKRN